MEVLFITFPVVMALAQINKLHNFRASTGSTVACPAEREKPALVLYPMQPLRVSVPVFLHDREDLLSVTQVLIEIGCCGVSA